MHQLSFGHTCNVVSGESDNLGIARSVGQPLLERTWKEIHQLLPSGSQTLTEYQPNGSPLANLKLNHRRIEDHVLPYELLQYVHFLASVLLDFDGRIVGSGCRRDRSHVA